MDLLHKRYASPFSFMDGMIQTRQFSEFVDKVLEAEFRDKEERLDWEFYLHKIFEGSFKDFKEEMETSKKNREMTKAAIETAVQHSNDILRSFNPENEGGAK